MNIYSYIDRYGNLTFKEKEFNEVDNIIFAFLSYADFKGIIKKNKKIRLQEAAYLHEKLHPRKEKNITAVKEVNKVLRYLRDTRRYGDCLLYDYIYKGTRDVQFGVLCIEYLKNRVYVSFEGTDELFSGWKEDLKLSLEFPTISHQMAIDYLNERFTISNKKLIIGGHSKGGNLALVAAAYSNILVRAKIKSVYNIDGPGLLQEQFESSAYRRVLKKYYHYIPNYSIIGLILNDCKMTVVKSFKKGPYAHNVANWVVSDDQFVRCELSPFSKRFDKELQNWLDKHSKDDMRNFIKNLEKICHTAEVGSFVEMMEEKKKILKLVYESKELTAETKSLLEDFLEMIFKCFKDTAKEELFNFFDNKKEIIKRTITQK